MINQNVDFKVRVFSLTFNHSEFVLDTLNGFTVQRTSFPYLCVILDDASTDGEQKLIRCYMDEHFNLKDESVIREETDDYQMTIARHRSNEKCYFAFIALKYNHFSIGKSKRPYWKKWSGIEYTAFCEGDDYWTDPQKLQKQVSFLDSHPDYAMSYTGTQYLDQGSGTLRSGSYIPFGGFKWLLMRNSIATLTVVIRTRVLLDYYEEIEPEIHNWPMGDYPIWLYLSANYQVHYLPDVTSVYRMHRGSASRPINFEAKKQFLEGHVSVQHYFAKKYDMPQEVIDAIDYKANYNLALACINYHQFNKAFLLMRKMNFKDKCNCIAHMAKCIFKSL